MNKKSLKAFAVAAMSVLAIACAKEPASEVGGETGVSFSIDVPGVPATKANGDGEIATKLYYQVFDAEGAVIEGLGVQNTTLVDKHAKVNFTLVKGQTYNFVFWAQTEAEGYYTIDPEAGLKKITANYAEKKNCNDENFDAFYAVEEIEVAGPVSATVTLKRPFAQINFATEGTIRAGSASREIDFTDAASTVTVKGIPTVFSPLADEQFSEVAAEMTFAKSASPAGTIKVAGKDYKYLAVNYVFAPVEGTVYDLSAKLTVEGKEVAMSVPAAPAKQNWRTNIVGNLLTAEAGFDVVTDPDFEGDEDIDLANIKNVASLKAFFANGGSAKLDADIELTADGVSVLPGTNAVLNLNGHKIISKVKNVPAIKVGGKLELTGEGTVDGGEGGNNSTICAMLGSELIIRGGTYTVGGDANNLANSCIYNYGGDIKIYGGYFRSECPYRGKYYVLNLNNAQHGSIVVYGGKFENYDPATGDDAVSSTFVADGYTSFLSGTYPNVYTVDSTAGLAANSAALRAAIENGGNIEVTENVLLSEGYPYSVPASSNTHISIAKDVTVRVVDNSFNLYKVFSFYNDGGVLSGEGTIIADQISNRNNVCAVEVMEGNTVVIEGNLHIDGGRNAAGNNSAIKIDNGTVIIRGGFFTVGLDKNGGDNACVLLYAEGSSSKATLIVEDGVFYAEGNGTFVINCQDENKSKCDVQLKGGIYVKFNPADNKADGEHTNYVAEGYKSVETTYNGMPAWQVVKE